MKTAMLGLHAETSIHAGAGAALEVVDLPIQREAPTGWPCVFGSAVKGALRACATARKANNVELVFGPGPEQAKTEANEFAGALLVGDARLVLLPVRSLSGHFKWVTCPAALERLKRDAERLGLGGLFEFDIPQVPAPVGQNPIALAKQAQESLFLEEYCFTVQSDGDWGRLIPALAQLSGVTGFEATLKNQLIVAHDDDFTFLANNATPVIPHIALNSNTKTTTDGALWYEETLPPESLLYVCLAAHAARKKDMSAFEAKDVLGVVNGVFFDKPSAEPTPKPYLQIGGNETVGMGWCKTAWVEKAEG